MEDYQNAFLDLCVRKDILRFGEFTLKSGRTSPYFFNAGGFDSGSSLTELGECYAHAITHSGIEFDMLFGPAYKGIPLVAAVSIAFAKSGRDLPFAFDRKEVKDHGEGGQLVGAPLQGRVLIVDDVVSAGTSVRYSIELIEAAGATASGVALALDRQERGPQGTSAVAELRSTFGLETVSVATLADLLEYLQSDEQLSQWAPAVEAYRTRYGSP